MPYLQQDLPPHRRHALSRKNYSPETIIRLITLLSLGCPLQAIIKAFEIDERTVPSWREEAGTHRQAFRDAQVTKQTMDLVQVQADDLNATFRALS